MRKYQYAVIILLIFSIIVAVAFGFAYIGKKMKYQCTEDKECGIEACSPPSCLNSRYAQNITCTNASFICKCASSRCVSR